VRSFGIAKTDQTERMPSGSRISARQPFAPLNPSGAMPITV
jgi:hypothetical protein